MTPTEKARRAESLYQDKTKRELADMVVHREADLEDARVENAKLRELLRDVRALRWSGYDCTECPRSFRGRCHEDGGCPWVFILTDRMRELGVDA